MTLHQLYTKYPCNNPILRPIIQQTTPASGVPMPPAGRRGGCRGILASADVPYATPPAGGQSSTEGIPPLLVAAKDSARWY
jgi:hypothetical protein